MNTLKAKKACCSKGLLRHEGSRREVIGTNGTEGCKGNTWKFVVFIFSIVKEGKDYVMLHVRNPM